MTFVENFGPFGDITVEVPAPPNESPTPKPSPVLDEPPAKPKPKPLAAGEILITGTAVYTPEVGTPYGR